MASVRKRILLSGEIRWQVDYRDRAGKRRSKQFRRKAEADSYETKVRSEIAAGTHFADSASVTVNEAGDLWLRRPTDEPLEAGTLRQYRQHIKYHIAPLIGETKLSKLTTPAIEKFRDDLLATRSRPLSRAVLTSLKGILKEARRLGLIGHDPAASTAIGKVKRHQSRVEIPEKAQIRALLEKSAELFPMTRVEITRTHERKVVAVAWRPMIVTAIFTGLRSSELRGLCWSSVRFDDGVIRVSQRADFQNDIGAPKSAAGNRDVPMSPMVTNTLRTWKLACPKTRQDLVFPNENGAIHSTSNIHRQCWAPLQTAALGARTFPFHALRHAAASLLIDQGLSPKKVQVIMGHSSIQVTFDIYGHLFRQKETDLEAMAQIEAKLMA